MSRITDQLRAVTGAARTLTRADMATWPRDWIGLYRWAIQTTRPCNRNGRHPFN